jgi:hypothetical protein
VKGLEGPEVILFRFSALVRSITSCLFVCLFFPSLPLLVVICDVEVSSYVCAIRGFLNLSFRSVSPWGTNKGNIAQQK